MSFIVYTRVELEYGSLQTGTLFFLVTYSVAANTIVLSKNTSIQINRNNLQNAVINFFICLPPQIIPIILLS